MAGPVETKVYAATIASTVSGLGLWALQTYVFRTDVPLPVVAAVTTVVPAAITFVAGYLAPHTPRPDLRAGAAVLEPDPEDATSSGRHVLDDDPDDLPVSRFETPRSYRTHDENNEQRD